MSNQPIIYLAQLEGTLLAKKREALRQKLELLKQMPHDKMEFKRQKDEIIREMNSLTYDIDGKLVEMYRQNYEAVKTLLMMFASMDFVSRVLDDAGDTFKRIAVGNKRDELLDFVKLCREAATKANEVVRIIDSAGKDMASMAYAEMEDGIGETMLEQLRQKVDAYGKTPEGRRYFYGNHKIT